MNTNWLPRFCLDENTAPPTGGGGDAPASTPASTTPASIPSPPETSPVEGGGDPFAGMDDDLDSVDLSAVPTGDEPGVAAPPPAPPAPATPPGAPPAAPAAPTPVAPQAPGAPPSGNLAASPPRSQLDFALEGFKTNGKELSEWASQNLFALSKEDAEALDTSAVDMIPKLMGRVYTQAIQATTNLIKNFVPEMVSSGVMGQQQRAAKAAEALSEFYQSNPHLNAEQHGAAVDKWARAFRAANPQASRKDAIAFVGRAVSADFGLASGAARPSGRPTPFAPARPGGRAPQGQQPHDPYAGMEDDIDQ